MQRERRSIEEKEKEKEKEKEESGIELGALGVGSVPFGKGSVPFGEGKGFEEAGSSAAVTQKKSVWVSAKAGSPEQRARMKDT
jgi:hypothetical protein